MIKRRSRLRSYQASFRMRVLRRRLRYRARYKQRDLVAISNRTDQIKKHDIICTLCIYNEHVRLPFFLDYYRALGVNHFLVIDNQSTDKTQDYLAEQPDVSLWRAQGSYKKSRFGMDWVNHLLSRYGAGHWCLTVDVDEFFVYPFCDTRPLSALTEWLDTTQGRSFGTLLLDLYPHGPVEKTSYTFGDNPIEKTRWFDPGNYSISRDPKFGNLWIQGGARARALFQTAPKKAPALNKIPLVKWKRHYAYYSSTHMLLPRGLNLVYDEWGGERTSGVLLHTKFLSTISDKLEEERTRNQHYKEGREYAAYGEPDGLNLWCSWSEKYMNWRQLEVLGLISKGNWA